jgi:hypothetical protein
LYHPRAVVDDREGRAYYYVLDGIFGCMETIMIVS